MAMYTFVYNNEPTGTVDQGEKVPIESGDEYREMGLVRSRGSGKHDQLCGDAHLSNFGVYGAPNRSMVFDINDFDETLTGPWKWDLKRLATSFVLASRENGWDAAVQHSVATASAASYREAMRTFAEMDNLEVWYSRLSIDDLAAVRKPTKASAHSVLAHSS